MLEIPLGLTKDNYLEHYYLIYSATPLYAFIVNNNKNKA